MNEMYRADLVPATAGDPRVEQWPIGQGTAMSQIPSIRIAPAGAAHDKHTPVI